MTGPDLVIEDIEISGFMSFPPRVRQKLNLHTNNLTAIIGENLDIGFGERNGAGKTAVLDALLYVNWGKTFRVTSNQSLINYIEPGPLLVTSMASRNGIRFRVERGENPSVLRLFEKSVDDDRDWYTKEDGKFLFERTKSTKPETTKRIIELIGFDLKLTDVLLFNNPSDKSCFFLKDEEDQRNIVERVFGFTIFTDKAKRLRDIRKEENKNLTTMEGAFIATKQANDRVLREITTLEEKADEWIAQLDKTARFLTQQIHTYRDVDFDTELAVLVEHDQHVRGHAEVIKTLHLTETNQKLAQKRHDDWEKQQNQLRTAIQYELTALRKSNPEADLKTLKERTDLNAALNALRPTLQQHRSEHTAKTAEIERQQSDRKRLNQQIDQLETKILHLEEQKCPTCGQEWHGAAQHVEECLDLMRQYVVEIEEIDQRLVGLQNEQAFFTESIQKTTEATKQIQVKLTALPETTFDTPDEAAGVHVRIAELTARLEQHEQAQSPHAYTVLELDLVENSLRDQIEKLKARIAAKPDTTYSTLEEAKAGLAKLEQLHQQLADTNAGENPYRETIENLRSNALKEVDDTKIKTLKKRIDHMSLLINLLADRDSPIRKDVLNDYLPVLNERMNHYLNVLELPHRVEFDADMTATFTMLGKPLSFGNLSTGQRLRVWLATNRVFREIFELINYPINLFFVDEVLDKGLSTRGADVSYRFLQTMVKENKSVFLITHRNELCDIADNTVTVMLENGLSTLMAA